ncbi:MAG: hypothetical protein U0R65_00265 [Candidatus Nanopelagicales bacterium]
MNENSLTVELERMASENDVNAQLEAAMSCGLGPSEQKLIEELIGAPRSDRGLSARMVGTLPDSACCTSSWRRC